MHHLRKSRRGAAGKPSGMRTEHLKGLLERDWLSWRTVWPRQMSRRISCVHCVWGASPHCRDPTGCGALLSESSFANWWRALWRSNFRSRPKKRRLLTSTHWKPRRVRVRGTRHPSIDRPRHSCVCGWGGGFRLHFTESGLMGNEGRWATSALCKVVLRRPFHVPLGR